MTNRPIGPRTVQMSTIKPTQLKWLWPDRLPLGKLCLLVGDPGLGKSMLTCDLAARISLGAAWPDENPTNVRDAAGVFLAGAEDDPADTIRPRLDAAGADTNHIYTLEQWHLGRVNELAGLIQSVKPTIQLVVIDPAQAYVPSTINANNNSDVRMLLTPLKDMAAALNVTVLMVDHLNKRSDVGGMYRANGSIAWLAAARAAHAVARDPQNPDRVVFDTLKCNLSARPLPLAYRIDVDPNTQVGRVVWEQGACTSIEDILSPQAANPRNKNNRNLASDWLLEQLAEGPQLVSDITAAAALAGFSWRTVERARAALPVLAIHDGETGRWSWTLGIHRAQGDEN